MAILLSGCVAQIAPHAELRALCDHDIMRAPARLHCTRAEPLSFMVRF